MEMGYVLNYILFLLPIFVTFILVRKSKKIAQTRAKLPPGSMGWPYIGETLELYSQDPNDFFAAKQKRFAVSTRFFYIIPLSLSLSFWVFSACFENLSTLVF